MSNADIPNPNRNARPGDRIKFKPRYHTASVVAVVMRVHVYSWCLGASTMDVYAPETHCVYSLPYFIGEIGGSIVERNEGAIAAAVLLEAREHYKQHLMTYPKWAEHFENGGSLSW